MYRRSSLRKLAEAAGDLAVVLPEAQQRLIESANPSVNCDLEREEHTDANAQSRK